jgi:hypothetical protein
MKINYKNTALSLLDNPMSFPMNVPEYTKVMTLAEEEDFKYSIRMAVSTAGFKEAWKNNVQYVTRPFWDAYARSQSKIKTVVQETAFEEAGTLIIPWKDHTQTIFYALRTNGVKESWDYEVMIMMFTKSPHSEEFGLDLFLYLSKEDNDCRERIWKGFEEQGRDIAYWIADLMCFKTFLKYAEVETKIVNAKRKEKHLGEKYVNETDYKVQILDSTYFTTISRTDGFGVRGHFRFQPWGPGLTQKRLQWIEAYQKEGYTKTAKILSQ